MKNVTFGNILKNLRIKSNLSQKQVADKLAISRQSVSKWEQDISLPQINYLIPLTKILKCNIEDLFIINEERRNDKLMIKENFKVVTCKYLHGNLYDGLKKLYNDDKYFGYKVREVNYCNNDVFFIVGIYDSNIIGSCMVLRHDDNPNFFLISDFLIKEEYRNKGFGSRLIDSTISILEDHNAFKICAFATNEISEKIFVAFGFKKNESIKDFGRVVPRSNDDIYYELKLNIDINLEDINIENARLISLIMDKYTKKYLKDIPGLLRPGFSMWRSHLMSLNSYDGQKAFAISCGNIVIGYTNMFYEDYGDKHYVSLHIVLDEKHLYEEAVNICIDKAKVFYNELNQNFKPDYIKTYVNNNYIIMEQHNFYRKALLHNGFISDDNELYYLNLTN